LSTTIPILKNEKEQRQYKAGDLIFKAGDIGGLMFGVIDGEVEIHVHDRVVEVVTAGGVVGEVSLVDDGPRSATAIARTDCQLAAIDNHRFMLMVAQNPWFSLQVMRVLADRLRRWGV
jgi:CRP/FNR family transcriptional regulator, cyclic AMP receptor protein